MIIAKLAVVALLLFGAVSVAGAMGVILALLFGPEDDYERDLADRGTDGVYREVEEQR